MLTFMLNSDVVPELGRAPGLVVALVAGEALPDSVSIGHVAP